ncbi:MAG: hypothetical protein IPK93_02030 [Solirubrobacterales bacterium]|nr:hypothetical protein [Solirubrobacterales bacterium]
MPIDAVSSGQNKIRNKPITGSGKPAVDGWITAIKPDLVYTDDGTIPDSSKVMFHHGVWINISRGGQFYATGEEKTQMVLPDGYGYRYKASDIWILNEMVHNLTPTPMDLTVTYRINFIPDTAPEAASIKDAKPIWMDVEDGQNRGYPVFDVLRDSGGADGEFTYPQDDPNAYPAGTHLNEWKAPRAGTLLGTTGHVHTGGLNTELFMKRPGASYTGPTCDLPKSYAGKLKSLGKKLKRLSAKQRRARKAVAGKKLRKLRNSMSSNRYRKYKKSKKARLKKIKRQKKSKLKAKRKLKGKAKASNAGYKACLAVTPNAEGNRVRLFESTAKYFEPAGPVSWDMAMLSTKDDWRVQVKPGDTLELQATYETKIGSWYESMGINVVFWSDETNGRDPYVTKVDTPGQVNHGHYPENDDHGGKLPAIAPDPSKLPDGLLASDGPFDVGGYTYEAGGFNLPGANGRPPVVEQGKSFSFKLADADANKEIWHSLTSCKSPCNKTTGIAYPLPDGDFQFDSGTLGNLGGNAAPPTVGRTTWSTPADLPVGTHTYYCRIHPLMRGSFRVKQSS